MSTDLIFTNRNQRPSALISSGFLRPNLGFKGSEYSGARRSINRHPNQNRPEIPDLIAGVKTWLNLVRPLV